MQLSEKLISKKKKKDCNIHVGGAKRESNALKFGEMIFRLQKVLKC